jgi:ADP-ribosylglycohydrolase
MGPGWLESRIAGSLYGGAIGDALGGPVEGWKPDEVIEVHGGPVSDLLPYLKHPRADKDRPPRPPGTTTDDTHFKNLLCQAIIKANGRVDAERFALELSPDDPFAYLVMRQALLKLATFKQAYRPQAMHRPHMPLTDTAAHHGGRGLTPANGAVMMISPVGLLFPGDPHAAYLAAYEVACAIQQGYAADMAGVVACAVAAALVPETNIRAVVDAMIEVAPGSGAALLKETVRIATAAHGIDEFRATWQAELSIHFLDPGETVAVAAGCLLLAEGTFADSTLNAVNFGRDCDSIATVAGAIAGALQGLEAIPTDWITTVEQARGDEPSPADLADGVHRALAAELSRARQWANRYEALL